MKILRPENFDSSHYFIHYINAAPGSELLSSLAETEQNLVNYINGLDENKGDYAYADGKWTVKQVIQHLIDTERIMAYRALRFSRKDATALMGFEQDDFAANDFSKGLSLNNLKTEFVAVRKTTELLYQNMNPKVLDFKGLSSQFSISPRALGWMMSGHIAHHLNVLKERY